jgi:hypothetical protein
MAQEKARRVIAGLNESGRSTILQDGHTETWVVRPNGAVVQELWRQTSVPAKPGDDGTRGQELELAPPPAGVVVRTYTCPPDHEANLDAYGAAAEAIYGDGNAAAAGSFPGMHRTQTLDVNVVVAGELYAVFEDGETLLRAGDCIVVPGTMRAWSNRSDSPATLVSTCFTLAD